MLWWGRIQQARQNSTAVGAEAPHRIMQHHFGGRPFLRKERAYFHHGRKNMPSPTFEKEIKYDKVFLKHTTLHLYFHYNAFYSYRLKFSWMSTFVVWFSGLISLERNKNVFFVWAWSAIFYLHLCIFIMFVSCLIVSHQIILTSFDQFCKYVVKYIII